MNVYILIGYPASGKTTFAEENLVSENCIRIDGDSLKTAERMNIALLKILYSEKSAIVDATNMTLIRRSAIFEALNKFGMKKIANVIGIWFQMSLENCYARNRLRKKPIPKIAYYKLRKDFVEPTLEEGFTEIINCDKNDF